MPLLRAIQWACVWAARNTLAYARLARRVAADLFLGIEDDENNHDHDGGKR